MTVRRIFRESLGKKKFERLPRYWKEHIRRIDSLPKPKDGKPVVAAVPA